MNDPLVVVLPWLAAAGAALAALLLSRARRRDRRDLDALQAERDRLAAELAEARREIATTAHELKNPLASVVTAAHLLRRAPHTPDGEAALELLEREAAHAAGIVRDVLALSRDGAAAERRPVELNALVRDVATASPAAVLGGARVELDLAERPLVVEGDAAQLGQLLRNLLANAAQALAAAADDAAAPPGGRRIVVRTALEAGRARLEVADDGPGIAPEHLPHVWTPFWTTRGADGGTGLGLAVVHGVAAAHGGTVRVESVPGAGARFRVLLPLAAAPATEPLDVLVVDPDPARAADTARALGARGHAVLLAHDAADAVRLAAAGAFDALVVDAALLARAPALAGRLRAAPGCAAARWVFVTDGAPPPALPAGSTALRRPHAPAALREAVEGR